jgi:hypothetical protein
MGQVRNQGITGKVSREGLATFTIPFHVDTLDAAIRAGDKTFLGVPLTERSFTERTGGADHGFDCVCSYEGLTDDQAKGDNETFEWRGSFSKDPIETHPRINDMIALYGGRIGADGKVTFDPKLPEGSTGEGEGLDQGEDAPETEKNPLYGLDSYLVLGVTFSRTRVLKELPDDVLDGIGKVYPSIPWGNNFPTPNGRDWLGMAPSINQRGNAFEISDNLMLSAPGGWPRAVHALIRV